MRFNDLYKRGIDDKFQNATKDQVTRKSGANPINFRCLLYALEAVHRTN